MRIPGHTLGLLDADDDDDDDDDDGDGQSVQLSQRKISTSYIVQ